MSHLKLVPDLPDFTLAACRESWVEFNWFFPSSRQTPTSLERSYLKARKVCMTCPVRVECLEWELQYELLSGRGVPGMFGGLTPRERQKVLREREQQ